MKYIYESGFIAFITVILISVVLSLCAIEIGIISLSSHQSIEGAVNYQQQKYLEDP